MRYMYMLNTNGLKAGCVYAFNRGYALNNGVCLTTRVYTVCQDSENILTKNYCEIGSLHDLCQ